MSEIPDHAEREFHETWRRTRLMGRRRFALTRGVAFWGGLSALALIGGSIVLNKFNVVLAALQITLFALGGYVVGIKMWAFNERRFALKHPGTGVASPE